MTSRTSTSTPTGFPELNELLQELVTTARAILGDSFAGAYLQGSFAVGDADIYSDCDFLIPVHEPITPDQERQIRALHNEIPTRPGHWTQHLEGSYPVREDLRSLDGQGREWLYIDHGWRDMSWSTHCNNEFARWSLRERGIILAGEDPRDWMDPVPPEALRARSRASLETFWDDLATWISLDIAWAQRYAVTTTCRLLYTLVHAEVASKRRALEWAGQTLDARWQDLLSQTLADRSRGFNRDDEPRPGSVEATAAFYAYALAWAASPS